MTNQTLADLLVQPTEGVLSSDEAPVCKELSVDVVSQKHGAGISESYVVKCVNTLFEMGLRYRASDIHLEPQKQGLFVRFRIDGALQTIHKFAKEVQPPLISRIKIMANLDIAEKRLPQDGQINFKAQNREIDIRISVLPSKYGEKLVIRILDKSNLVPGLENLGFDSDTQAQFETLIEKPYGILLVTGPTGSGKTTTLYSLLQRLKSPLKNIITLEDPIEYELLAGSSNDMGVTQVQVNPKIGLTFAAGLKSALRQDPDIIMVGEIRDKETSEIAMKSAMTGHLVFSTLHTNDAPSTLGRLKDMGIDTYLINSTILGILAQRLVRVLCKECKQAYRPPARLLQTLFPKKFDLDKATFFRRIGCERCQGSGYYGRCGIYELMIMNEDIKTALTNNASLFELREKARAAGLKTLRETGLSLVCQGLTTVEEVFRCTME